ncbi:MAG: cation transporter [Burkholderiaceae bacterium]|nr:cation transporter [Burkholderiaceae bacterium]
MAATFLGIDRRLALAVCSILVGLVVFGLKYLAWHVTGSVALFADALESIVNVVAAAAVLVALHVSVQPADRGHPFGHTKAEYFSAVLEGVLIVIAAFSILRESWLAIWNPRALEAPLEGMLINGLATVLNAAWAALLLRLGARWRSVALVADGRHLVADVWTSVGVLVGLLLAVATGWHLLDPLVAALVALNIVRIGVSVIRQSVGGLMDEAAAPDVVARIESTIRDAITTSSPGPAGFQALRTRHAGRTLFVEFTLVVEGGTTVEAAHALCDRLEEAVGAEVDGAEVVIHVEPRSQAAATPRDRRSFRPRRRAPPQDSGPLR